ncbi:hypothetical protein EDC04DRAFT_2922759 [Pisolithus marmoratus]|nr:hypothetical protein EDC04DRAFT_2922759 [Pisolithus marmoratus]
MSANKYQQVGEKKQLRRATNVCQRLSAKMVQWPTNHYCYLCHDGKVNPDLLAVDVTFKCPGCHELGERNAQCKLSPYHVPLLFEASVKGSPRLNGSLPKLLHTSLEDYHTEDLLVYEEVFFDVGTDKKLRQWNQQASVLGTRLAVQNFGRKIIFIMVHSEINHGDLFAGKDKAGGDVAMEVEDFMKCIFTPPLDKVVYASTLFMLTCSHLVTFDESYTTMKQAIIRLRPKYTIMFTAPDFISAVAKMFVVTYSIQVLIQGHDLFAVFQDLLNVSTDLRMHTDWVQIFVVPQSLAPMGQGFAYGMLNVRCHSSMVLIKTCRRFTCEVPKGQGDDWVSARGGRQTEKISSIIDISYFMFITLVRGFIAYNKLRVASFEFKFEFEKVESGLSLCLDSLRQPQTSSDSISLQAIEAPLEVLSSFRHLHPSPAILILFLQRINAHICKYCRLLSTNRIAEKLGAKVLSAASVFQEIEMFHPIEPSTIPQNMLICESIHLFPQDPRGFHYWISRALLLHSVNRTTMLNVLQSSGGQQPLRASPPTLKHVPSPSDCGREPRDFNGVGSSWNDSRGTTVDSLSMEAQRGPCIYEPQGFSGVGSSWVSRMTGVEQLHLRFERISRSLDLGTESILGTEVMGASFQYWYHLTMILVEEVTTISLECGHWQQHVDSVGSADLSLSIIHRHINFHVLVMPQPLDPTDTPLKQLVCAGHVSPVRITRGLENFPFVLLGACDCIERDTEACHKFIDPTVNDALESPLAPQQMDAPKHGCDESLSVAGSARRPTILNYLWRSLADKREGHVPRRDSNAEPVYSSIEPQVLENGTTKTEAECLCYC